jgi:hypothetical protein
VKIFDGGGVVQSGALIPCLLAVGLLGTRCAVEVCRGGRSRTVLESWQGYNRAGAHVKPRER